MSDWTRVVTDPLGLAGFALFLLFGTLGQMKRTSERQWVFPVAYTMAVIALLGGLMLAYQRARPQVENGPPHAIATPHQEERPSTEINNHVDQKTTGRGSPAVQGVRGDVTITIDQSNSAPASHKRPSTTSTAGEPLK
jgi:hypothetical protein